MDINAQNILAGLSEEERSVALQILEQYANTGESDLMDDLKFSDFDEIPVSIDEFLDNEIYLGKGLWQVDPTTGERKCTLFPYWRDTLNKIFPDNLTTAYNTFIMTGAIGLGKSLAGVLAMLYMLYRLLCLKDPYAFYGLQPIDKITVALMNITLDAAKGVAWDKLQQLLQSSEWFLAHGSLNASKTDPVWQPNKNIELIYGSNNRHIVGRALFCLDGDTEILTSEGVAKLKNLVDKPIQVYTQNNTGSYVLSDFCTVKPTLKTNEEFQIELEDGSIIKCTGEHLFRLKSGEYKKAKDLTDSDDIMFTEQPISYFEYIDSIIEKRGQWGLDSNVYWEGHHIIPKCLGGTGNPKAKHNNIIRLTPEEHFTAHKLLALENPSNRSLVGAWNMMTFPKGKTKRNIEISKEDYGTLRRLWGKHMSQNNPGIAKTGHPWNFGIGKKISKSYIYITNGFINKRIKESDLDHIPDGFKVGITHKKDLKPTSFSIKKRAGLSGQKNGMYNNGQKVSGGKNGHATMFYFFENKTYDCRKNLIAELIKYDSKISTSTIRKLINGSIRVLREHPILDKVTWEVKKKVNEN